MREYLRMREYMRFWISAKLQLPIFIIILQKFSSLGYPEKLNTHIIKAIQTKLKNLRIFVPHPFPVYIRLPYMGVNSIRIASQIIKSSFSSASLDVVYNTNRPLNGIVKDATPAHELSKVVYVFSYHCRNDYADRTF